MATASSKLYADDVSLVVVLLDTNPFFWSTSSFSFSQFLSHVLTFLNAILTLNQLNQVVVIATGYNSCDYIYDSSSATNQSFASGRMPALCADFLKKLEEFMIKDEQLGQEEQEGRIACSLLSGSLSMALCYIQRVFRSGALHPQPRILCLQGSPDGPEQYVAIMNAIFSAQRSMVPIDSCYFGSQNSAFLQQASYITGGVHHKPQQLDGFFQYLLVYILFTFLRNYKSYLGLQFSELTCILAVSFNFLSLLVLIFVPRVFAIKIQLTWDTYVLYVCQYFVSVTKNVRRADLYLVRPNQKKPQRLTERERLQTHNLIPPMLIQRCFVCLLLEHNGM